MIFDGLTGEKIRKTILRCSGSAGPSGMDVAAWQRLCTAFRGASTDLCNSIAAVGRKLCTEELGGESLSAYVACRLIALDKSPGVRPIGVAEVLRRIIGKAIMSIVKVDVQQAAGHQHLCAGQGAGVDAAIHALRKVFDCDNVEGVLLVDASNAFNRLNRKVALHNVKVLCPAIHTALQNTYQRPAELYVDHQVLLSEEGVTQGDPLSMAFYALATVPLAQRCKVDLSGEAWFADDAAGSSTILILRNWWDKLVQYGPAYGYFVNGSKTWLVVKEQHLTAAKAIFANTEVQVSSEGHPHLGAPLGSQTFVNDFVSHKVNKWVKQLAALSTIAETDPQAAYCAYVHGFQSSWTHLARTTPGTGNFFEPLEAVIRNSFIPALIGQQPDNLTRDLFALPPRFGGLGLRNPVKSALDEFHSSLQLSANLVVALLPNDQTTEELVSSAMSRPRLHQQRQKMQAEATKVIAQELPPDLRRCVSIATSKGSSSWLTALPIAEHGFALSKAAFRDALRLRYGLQLENLPTSCVCGEDFTTDHALNCPTGGYPSIRHNQVRDLLVSLMDEVCIDVRAEPQLQPLSGEVFERSTTTTKDDARLDIRAQGFWDCRQECTFFDVRVFNPCAPSYRHLPLESLFKRQEQQKRNLYEERVRRVERSTFVPLVFTTTSSSSQLTTTALKRLASLLSSSRNLPNTVVMGWLRCRLSFCLLRTAILSMRGIRHRRDIKVENIPDFAYVAARIEDD